MTTARRVAFFTCGATLVLVALGALVRATGSGLGCPDWPTCHGGVLPPGNEGHQPLIEFSHRFVAALVGLLVIATAVLAWRHYRHAPVTVWAAIVCVPLVGFQGILGAITVQRELPPEIVATHLVTAMLVLTCEAIVAYSMYVESRGTGGARPPGIERRLGILALGATAWLAVVMWIGGYLGESGGSTACSGWPLCNGSALPGSNDQEITHMVHRYLAALLVVALLPLLVALWKSSRTVRWARPVAVALSVLYVAQVAVGGLNVVSDFPDALTVGHTTIAAGVWFTLQSALVLGLYVPAERRNERLAAAGAPA